MQKCKACGIVRGFALFCKIGHHGRKGHYYIMGSKITGKEYPLSKIFSEEFDYHIPPYQRPYAWTEEEAETLFDDLLDFFQTEESDNYFLGSIVLIKDDDKPRADVIDGQQRLTTLTILFSVIASCLTGDNRNNCYKYLREPGNELEGLEPLPRLELREKDKTFFQKYIQNVRLEELEALDMESLPNESQQHIKANSGLFLRKMDAVFGKDEKKIAEFCRFLVTRCYLVAVYSPSRQSAFRMFSVMNSRGLNLMPVDIIKSDIIGKLPEKEQQYYTDKWEDLEVQTSRSGFNEVFAHTNMIFSKAKAKKNLLEEFREAVLTKVTPRELIDDILEPYAEAYVMLANRKYVAVKNAEQVNQYLFWLNKIGNSDWMPPAIKFLAEHKNDPDYVLWFMERLERLASFLHITAKDINRRIERYKRLLEEMEMNPDHSLDDPLASIELSNEEKREFADTLDGEIYKLTGIRRNFVILRLNEFVGDGAAKFDFEPNILTIEHVLPQTVRAGSEWEKLWPDTAMRERWGNRIANLVPLTRKKNSEAQNHDFEKKKEIYFKGKSGTTTYPLATQVLNEKTWTPETVESRQKELMNKFIECWRLSYAADAEGREIAEEDAGLFFIASKRGADSSGYPTEGGFVVKAGSKVSDAVVERFEINYPNAYKLRNSLCKEGVISGGIFQSDYEFDSISLAASLILGRRAIGQKEWVDSAGTPYDESVERDGKIGEFNINDESTYGALKVGSLAFELFKKVLETGNITDEEIEKLKGKEYSKQLFSKTDYPIFADNREDNRGNSNVIRYRKEPIRYKGKDIYFTTQWFAGNRNDVIAWYHKHL